MGAGATRSQAEAGRRTAILVIKHGALGDFVLATGPFAAIRQHHGEAHITLLTTRPFVGLARQCAWFDEVWSDPRPKIWQIGQLCRLRRRLITRRFARVYDLQTSSRSSLYFHLLRRPRPEWSGIARGCSHPHANPRRDDMHSIERQAEQLAMAGIESVPASDISWLDADISTFGLTGRYVLLVPGGAAHRPRKRWLRENYAELAQRLSAEGVRPVLLGTEAEGEVLKAIASRCPAAMDLCGRTDFAEITALARGAAGAVGNDTGPMHLIAAAGCPAVVLFSDASDPSLCAPRGPQVVILREPRLADLSVDRVYGSLTLR